MFAKVHGSLFHGSMTGQPEMQLVFVFMLTRADFDGVVDVHPRVIAALTGFSGEAVEKAIVGLESPDPHSTTPDNDGRRISRIERPERNAWSITNYRKYREMRDTEDRRRQTQEATRRYRSRIYGEPEVSQGEPSVSQGEPSRAHVDVDVDVDKKKNLISRRRSAAESEPEGFVSFYETYPRRDGRRAAAKAFSLALKRRPEYTASDLSDAAKLFRVQCQQQGKEARFIPMPATWLNQDRYREFFDEGVPDAQTAHEAR